MALYDDDVRNLAHYLGLVAEEFVMRYTTVQKFVYRLKDCERSLSRLVLRRVNGRCCFLAGELCSVHERKPFQCRLGPFLNPWLSDRKTWSAFAKLCPGVGTGRLINPTRLEKNVRRQNGKEQEYQGQLADPASDMHRWVTRRRPARISVIRISETIKQYLSRTWST